MIRIALQTCLTIMALLISVSASLAAECADDPNECTLKKLCEVATTVDGGNTIWSTASGSSKHVTVAQSLDMECGITAIVDLCDTDPSECKLSQICGKATTDNTGQVSWNDSASAYVALAKEYGLSCDVVVKTAVEEDDICSLATYKTVNSRAWTTSITRLAFREEAKKRGLSCGVGEVQATSVKKECSASNVDGCSKEALCKRATYKRSGIREWIAVNNKYVKEAKKRGLTCGVSEVQATNFKQAFSSQSKLYRKQIQFALKTLGFYSSSIDGLWGRGTSSAIVDYAQANGVGGNTPNSVFRNIVTKVDVPLSFAAPKLAKPKKIVTKIKPAVNTNASNYPKGWRPFAANPLYSFDQAEAICEPRAKSAGDTASDSAFSKNGSSFSCNSYGSSTNCRDTSGPSGIAESFLAGVLKELDRGTAKKRVMKSCMAQYGWTKQ
jgi:hypothetical protein